MDASKPQGEGSLLQRATHAFPPRLSTAERTLLTVATSGDFAFCGPTQKDDDPHNQPATGSQWGADRAIRAGLIEWLCTKELSEIPALGIRIHGARIDGPLDLSYSSSSLHLVFAHCLFASPVNMRMFDGREVSFYGSKVPGIDMRRSNLRGSLFLSAGFVADGQVDLSDVNIGKELNCSDGTFLGIVTGQSAKFEDCALEANSITVGLDTVLDDCSFPNCGIDFSNSRLGGDFSARGAKLTSQLARTGGGEAGCLSLQTAHIHGDMYLGEGFVGLGTLSLDGLVCDGDLSFSGGADLKSSSGEDNDGAGAITADNAQIGGNVLFDSGFLSTGQVSFGSVRLGGDFQADHAEFRAMRGQTPCLVADNSIFKGDIKIQHCKISGSASFFAAQVEGDLNLSDSEITCQIRNGISAEDSSLALDNIAVRGSVDLSGLNAVGYISARSVHIGDDFALNRAQLRGRIVAVATKSPYAILAENSFIGMNLQANSLTAEGLFSILGSTVGGQFDATDGSFANPYAEGTPNSGVAILAERASFKGPVFLRGKFSTIGRVNLNGASLGANLECVGAKFNSRIVDLAPKDDSALSLIRAQVTGDVRLINDSPADPFVAIGKICFDYARFDGEVLLDGAQLSNPYLRGDPRTGVALTMFSAKCARGLYLRNGFVARGEVYIANSEIAQVLSCRNGTFTAPAIKREDGSDYYRALAIRSTDVRGSLEIDQDFCLNGILDLTGSTTTEFWDDPKTWPAQNQLRVEGFKYSALMSNPKDAKGRLRWLSLQLRNPVPEQSYLQLSKFLSQEGDDDGAQTVLIKLEDERTYQHKSAAEGIARRALLGRTVGYGYTPLNAIWGLAALSAVGWIIYRRAYLSGFVVPTNDTEREHFQVHGRATAAYGDFSSLMFSIENTVPLVKFGQADKWTPLSHLEEQPSVRRGAIRSLNGNLPILPETKVRQTREEDSAHPKGESVSWHRRVIRASMVLKRTLSDLVSVIETPPWVRYFVWLQIALGWILATLFVAGFTGLIHK